MIMDKGMTKILLILFVAILSILYLYKLYLDLKTTNKWIKDYEGTRRR
jgi:hypothetical protein